MTPFRRAFTVLTFAVAAAVAGVSAARAHEKFYVTTHSGANIESYDTSGASFGSVLDLSTIPAGGQMYEMRDVGIGPDALLYVVNASTNPAAGNLSSSLVRFAWNITLGQWQYYDTFASALSSPNLQHPFSFAFDGAQNVYLTNQDGNQSLAYSTGGLGAPTPVTLSTLFTLGGSNVPRQAVFGPNGNIFLVNEFTNGVQQYDAATGAFLSNFTSGGSLSSPSHLLFNGGYLYVNSPDNNKIEQFDATTGAHIGSFISGGHLDTPSGFTFDAAGDFYVANRTSNGSILKYHSDGSFDSVLISNVDDPEFIYFIPEAHPAGAPMPGIPEPGASGILLAGLIFAACVPRRMRRSLQVKAQAFVQTG